MHRRTVGTPGRNSGYTNASSSLPSHYHTPTRPSRKSVSDKSSDATLIACSNHDFSSIRKMRRSSGDSKWALLTVICVAMIVFVRAINDMSNYNALHKKLQDARDFHEKNTQALEVANMKTIELNQKAAILEAENEDLKKNLETQRILHEEKKKEDVKIKKRDLAIRNQLNYLKKQVQEVSHREALERFGPGPHFVEFAVIFAGMKEGDKPSLFTVETAPLDLMPHSVLLFLEAVEKGLWDETAFVHHANHIISATPTIYYSGESKRSEFDKAGLSQVAFQEYSDDYPHKPYTLGFSGRPGGPDFYISTFDNTEMHGPGGQVDAELIEEADPCFAKVVSGFDIVDKIYQKDSEAPTDVHVVGILSVRIVNR